jgi:hypothetical protein
MQKENTECGMQKKNQDDLPWYQLKGVTTLFSSARHGLVKHDQGSAFLSIGRTKRRNDDKSGEREGRAALRCTNLRMRCCWGWAGREEAVAVAIAIAIA